MKTYTIRETYAPLFSDRIRIHDHTGTLEELTQAFSYTLTVGKSYERERGNRKINLAPKTISSLVNNLNNARDNAARNGYSGYDYRIVEG